MTFFLVTAPSNHGDKMQGSHKPTRKVAFICFRMTMSHRYNSVVWRIIAIVANKVASTRSDMEVVTAAGAEAGGLGMGSHVTKTEQYTMTQLQADHCAVKKNLYAFTKDSLQNLKCVTYFCSMLCIIWLIIYPILSPQTTLSSTFVITQSYF